MVLCCRLVENPCVLQPCGNRGVCWSDRRGNYSCACRVGHTGRDCERGQFLIFHYSKSTHIHSFYLSGGYLENKLDIKIEWNSEFVFLLAKWFVKLLPGKLLIIQRYGKFVTYNKPLKYVHSLVCIWYVCTAFITN